MKRLIATLAAASLVTVAPAATSPAFAAGSPQIVDRCKADAAAGTFPEETIGNCVGLITTSGPYFSGTGANGFIAHICSFFMKSRPDDFYAVYDSYDECILDAATQLP